MNIKAILKIIGKIMVLEGIMMCAPLAVSIIYKEYETNFWTFRGIDIPRNIIAFAIPIFFLIVVGLLLQLLKPKRKGLYQREAFALCAMVWIVMALFGCIPFIINGDIPNFFNAFFETMSGFTTTGASVVPDVTILLRSTNFWRCFTHWIGGMGILVFILIFIPESDDGSALHLLKAESPGPTVGKLASKMKATTRILYLIYFGFTIIGFFALLLTPSNTVVIDGVEQTFKMDVYSSLLTIFGCAGTGGFGFVACSMEYFSPATQYVIATLLLCFGINFSLYFLILVGKIKDVFKSEELRAYLLIILISIVLIMSNLLLRIDMIRSFKDLSFPLVELRFRQSYFQVISIMTSCGYSSTNYQLWPATSKLIIVVLMFIGAMAGSTGGGIKVSRFVMAFKGLKIKIKKIINPRYVEATTFEGKILEEDTINEVFSFFCTYFFLLFGVVFLLSFDKFSNTLPSHYGSFTTNFTATVSCLSNIGPGLDGVGPYECFAGYNSFSKLLLTFTMLTGRLEIYPMIILLSHNTWRRR